MEQKIKRTINLPLYLGALVITVIIFGVGFYFGALVNEQLKDKVSIDIAETADHISKIQLFFLMDENKPDQNMCNFYTEELNKLDDSIEKTGYRLRYLEDEKGIIDTNLKKEYFVLETSSYLIAKKIEQKCNNNYNLIVYFYSNKNCEQCKKQGEEILNARDEILGKIIKIYSFDGELGSTLVDGLKKSMNVTEYPTTSINGKLIKDYITKDEIIKEISND